jgi:predicted kinase
MKRLPALGMMDAMLERGEVGFETIGRLVAKLAQFHRDAETSEEITRAGGLATLTSNWRENLDQTRPFIGRTLSRRDFDRVARFVATCLREEAPLLRQREQEGRVRDCHGDLRSDAVCFDASLDDGICLYDCIEFNDRFRYSDTGLDVAFLAMDLDYRGHAELSDLLIGLYAAATGDSRLPLLLNFYKAYRAWTRGKVESLLLDDAGVGRDQKAQARRRARAYFSLAARYARREQPRRLLLVMGPSGSGKSVLAGVLAARLGAVLLSTDMLRRGADTGAAPARDAALDRGRYAPEARERVYHDLAEQAGAALSEGRPVVVDGTFIERGQRDLVAGRARDLSAPLLVVECMAPDDVVESRQRQRAGETWTTSEGRYEVYLAQKARYQPPLEFAADERITIDTTATLERQIEAIEARLQGGGT